MQDALLLQAKRTQTVKNIMYVISLIVRAQCCKLGQGETFYRNVAIRTVKKIYQIRRLKTRIKHLRFLHVIVHIRHALWPNFWNQRRLKSSLAHLTPKTLPLRLFLLPRHCHCDYFMFPKLKISSVRNEIQF